jgi:heme exporter protein C
LLSQDLLSPLLLRAVNSASTASRQVPRDRRRGFGGASAQSLFALTGRAIPCFAVTAALFAAAGLTVGLVFAPTDPQQGEARRIVFVHLPAAWMSMLIFAAMALCCALGLLRGLHRSSMLATALAPTGALMSFIALWTGAMWARPVMGSWWGEAGLAIELLLLLMYFGFIAQQAAAAEDLRRADRNGGVIILAGAISLPIVHFALQWWTSSRPGQVDGLMRLTGSAGSLVSAGVLLMFVAAWAYGVAAALHRFRSLVLEREKASDWVRHQIGAA